MSEEIKIINGYKIYENLEHIRIRPLIALTSKSITALENYLWGYWVYANKNYSGEQIYNDGDPDFNEFKWWLSGQPNIPLSSGPRFHELLLEKWAGSYSRHDQKISLSIFTAFPVRSYSLNGLASHTLLRESFQGALQQDDQCLCMKSYSICD